jgi:hypothetical protein
VTADYRVGEVKDVPVRNAEGIKVIRWNPENILVKYNEATGSCYYSYLVPYTTRYMIMQADRDLLTEIPLLFLEAFRKQRLIRLSPSNLFHLRRPTLAEKDLGYGKPLIVHVLKDLYYLFTLRRGQEAIANEHIAPLDIIFPTTNADINPYAHMNLSSWRQHVQSIVENHRSDLNFKGISPVPLGTERIGGDGRALLITPELQYLNQTIIGGMGIPQDFLFGNLSWCLEKNSLFVSSSGLLKLSEVCPESVGISHVADMQVATKDGRSTVALAHHTEVRPQVRIKTRMGLELNGSPIHRVWVVNPDCSMSWKHLKDIQTGDYVAVPKATDLWGAKEMSDEEARLLGYMVAEGWSTERRSGFCNTDEEVIQDFTKCWEQVFNRPITGTRWRLPEDIPGHYGTKPVWYWDDKSDATHSIFQSYGLLSEYSEGKEVPLSVRQAPRRAVMQFMRALFEGDGCCPIEHESSPTILYISKSKELVHQIQLLLLNAGIRSCVYPPEGIDNTCYKLALFGEDAKAFMQEASFVSKRKVEAFNWDLPTEDFRRRNAKYPYAIDNLKTLKYRTNGDGAWVPDYSDIELNQETYTSAELATILNREVSSIIKYISRGQLKATKQESVGGRFATYVAKRADVKDFLSSGTMRKRAAVGQTTWDLNDNNAQYVNWDIVKELDPAMYERIQSLMKAGFFWEKVTEVTHSSEEIEMCDLTIVDTHSYIANGLVSHNTGSSITLRSLSNDFQHNQSQLLDLTLWMKEKVKVFMNWPDLKNLRFTDFKMADDIQRIQQLIALNAQNKVSDKTMLTEIGLDADEEAKLIAQEMEQRNKLQEISAIGQARIAGKSQVISYQYQRELTEMQMKDQQLQMQQQQPLPQQQQPGQEQGQPQMEEQSPHPLDAQQQQPMDPNAPVQPLGLAMPIANEEGVQPGAPQPGHIDPSLVQADILSAPGGLASPVDSTARIAATTGVPSDPAEAADPNKSLSQKVSKWAEQLVKMPKGEALQALATLREKHPNFAMAIERKYNEISARTEAAGNFGGATANPSTVGNVNMGSPTGKGMPRQG